MMTPPEVMMRGVDMLSLSSLSLIFSSSFLPAASLYAIEFEVWFLFCRHQRQIQVSSGRDILLILIFPQIRQTGVSLVSIYPEGYTKVGQVTRSLAYLSFRMLCQPPNSVITPGPINPLLKVQFLFSNCKVCIRYPPYGPQGGQYHANIF